MGPDKKDHFLFLQKILQTLSVKILKGEQSDRPVIAEGGRIQYCFPVFRKLSVYFLQNLLPVLFFKYPVVPGLSPDFDPALRNGKTFCHQRHQGP